MASRDIRPRDIVTHASLRNAMTVDVEDYFQVQAFAHCITRADWDSFPRRVDRNTNRILDKFAQAGVSATFFTLGWVAERFPGLVRRIQRDTQQWFQRATRAGLQHVYHRSNGDKDRGKQHRDLRHRVPREVVGLADRPRRDAERHQCDRDEDQDTGNLLDVDALLFAPQVVVERGEDADVERLLDGVDDPRRDLECRRGERAEDVVFLPRTE